MEISITKNTINREFIAIGVGHQLFQEARMAKSLYGARIKNVSLDA